MGMFLGIAFVFVGGAYAIYHTANWWAFGIVFVLWVLAFLGLGHPSICWILNGSVFRNDGDDPRPLLRRLWNGPLRPDSVGWD